MKIKLNFPQISTPLKSMRRLIGTLSSALLMLVALFHYSASAVAATATFTLQDQTGLPSAHKIYVVGWSSSPGYYLNSDGTWLPLPQQANGQIPCYQLGSGTGQISQAVIDSTQSTLSARVYFFADDTGSYPTCNNGTTSATSPGTNGIFGTTNFSYTYTPPSTTSPAGTPGTYGIQGITQTNIGQPNKGVPIYAYGEIGPGPSNGTIDVSQVDLFSFPVTIQANVTSGPNTIGNTFSSNAMSSVSFSDNAVYAAYMNKLAGSGGCKTNPHAPACAYLDLISPYGNYTSLLNPGGFLASNSTKAQSSKLATAFDSIITTLWATESPAITLNNGGAQGGAPQDTFTGTALSMTYPCNSTGTGCPTVQAIKFVGQSSGYVAYIFSPIGYADGCASGAITGCPAGSIASSGNQVFSGAGVFASTANNEYSNLVAIQGGEQSLLPAATTNYGVGAYNAQVARLGLIMTQAMNHGVALMQCPSSTPTWQCWNLETNWYPTQTSATYPDISQNLFSQFMHTASNTRGIPFFVQPPSAVQSAGGATMGMAYGFSNDEQPTPPVPNSTNPEVPSKMDGTVIYNGTGPYTITLGPWASGSTKTYYIRPQISTAPGTNITVNGVQLKNLLVYTYTTPSITALVNGSPYTINLINGTVTGANPSTVKDTIKTQKLPSYGRVSVNQIVFPAPTPTPASTLK
ncbi:MAG TPA: hypothetical protein VIE65_23215 [Methylobacter sp.]|jgi:hypothetical protein